MWAEVNLWLDARCGYTKHHPSNQTHHTLLPNWAHCTKLELSAAQINFLLVVLELPPDWSPCHCSNLAFLLLLYWSREPNFMHLVCAKFGAVVRSCLTESLGHDFEAASHLSGEGLPRFISSPEPLMWEPPVLGLPFFLCQAKLGNCSDYYWAREPFLLWLATL